MSDYEARAKLWMSPAQNAERFLLPLVTEFASWLRANRDILYQGSATEGLLRSIDEHLRSCLKNQVTRECQQLLLFRLLQYDCSYCRHRLNAKHLPAPSGPEICTIIVFIALLLLHYLCASSIGLLYGLQYRTAQYC